MKRPLFMIMVAGIFLFCIIKVNSPVTYAHEAGEYTIGDYTYVISEAGTASLKSYNGTETNIVIPNEVEGHFVTSIEDYAFSNCATLESVNISSGIASIGSDTFSGCESLKAIYVNNKNKKFSSQDGILFDKFKKILIRYPSGKTNAVFAIPNGVTSIGEHAFYKCVNLRNLTISRNVKDFGPGAFEECINMENAVIAGNVKSISDYAFASCIRLKGVTIPASVTEIGDYAFAWCESLTEITIPESVISIGEYAFASCTNLKEVRLSSNLTSIGKYAFAWCVNITSVDITSKVNEIGDYAFASCDRLFEAKFFGNAPTMGSNVFFNCLGGFKIYYHYNAIGYTTPYWSGYPAIPFTL